MIGSFKTVSYLGTRGSTTATDDPKMFYSLSEGGEDDECYEDAPFLKLRGPRSVAGTPSELSLVRPSIKDLLRHESEL